MESETPAIINVFFVIGFIILFFELNKTSFLTGLSMIISAWLHLENIMIPHFTVFASVTVTTILIMLIIFTIYKLLT